MDQLICASLSHTHNWYEVGIPGSVVVEMSTNSSKMYPVSILVNSAGDCNNCGKIREIVLKLMDRVKLFSLNRASRLSYRGIESTQRFKH